MAHRVDRLQGNGLGIAVHRFTDEGVPQRNITVLLLHGFGDAGGTWAAVAERLASRGLTVVAPDFRGFGDSDWIAGGGYYHFPDYVADTAAIVEQLAPARLVVVGHSMGGTVACLYAGTTGRAEKLGLLEGVGPPDGDPSLGPSRMQTWLTQLAKLGRAPADRRPKPLASLDEAANRLAVTHPKIARELLRGIVPHLVRERDGVLGWSFDPLHRTTAPAVFRLESLRPFLGAITCPVLFISGGDGGWHPPDERDRLLAFPSPPREIVLPDAGHMMHWTRPDGVAEAIADFIGPG